eukprot:jgi/Picre1/29395/NNA_004783.t1
MDESSGSLKKARALLESSPLLQQVAFATDVAWTGETTGATDDEDDTDGVSLGEAGEEMRDIVPDIVLSSADASVLERVEGIMARTSQIGREEIGVKRMVGERGCWSVEWGCRIWWGMLRESWWIWVKRIASECRWVWCMYFSMCVICISSRRASLIMGARCCFIGLVVLSDIARLVRDVDERIEYAVASCLKYAGVVSMEGDHAQALNNWGLVICDVANCVQGDDVKRRLYRVAISRFRKAIRMDCHSVETQSRFVII